ncbi:hypothetical protein A2870_04230 [Candidatus Curtissbacteria bacterium RIFCSPHIGHO2_01_FULL_41_11]|uniref:Uncharacterized protein n=1 Tax=Candidatus Curtissbacteria bacterium RIFCSPHIGHO2_01_FULL_41_11 TaxID=1797711 RepID=A0A1F5G6S4_9BACT|nr:MAG: hypothetical protein A2870_04230 [Candidatus Curtissbacteria bacterium RIFCSPHIGHO2_01_FULL_41_11]
MTERDFSEELLINAPKQKTAIEFPSVLRQAVKAKLWLDQIQTGQEITFTQAVNALLAIEFLPMDVGQVQELIKRYRKARVSQILPNPSDKQNP